MACLAQGPNGYSSTDSFSLQNGCLQGLCSNTLCRQMAGLLSVSLKVDCISPDVLMLRSQYCPLTVHHFPSWRLHVVLQTLRSALDVMVSLRRHCCHFKMLPFLLSFASMTKGFEHKTNIAQQG